MILKLFVTISILVSALFAPVLTSAQDFATRTWITLPQSPDEPIKIGRAAVLEGFETLNINVLVDLPDIKTAIKGKIKRSGQDTFFYPAFPFRTNTPYRIEIHLNCPDSKVCSTPPPVVVRFQIEANEIRVSPKVVRVRPELDVIPTNTLRLYIQFSRPMSQGDVYRHISLHSSDGKQIPSPFLNLGRGIWNKDQTQLTVLFDPGRLKSGVGPNLEVGRPLKVGTKISLKVSGDMLDAEGRKLGSDFSKVFGVTEPVSKRLDIRQWRSNQPEAGSRRALLIRTTSVLDSSQLDRNIVIMSPKGNRVPGRLNVADQEGQLIFHPLHPWQKGTYQLVVSSRIEDISGNTMQTAFEARNGRRQSRPQHQFSIRFSTQ